jgi:signal transduction histidine kinase
MSYQHIGITLKYDQQRFFIERISERSLAAPLAKNGQLMVGQEVVSIDQEPIQFNEISKRFFIIEQAQSITIQNDNESHVVSFPEEKTLSVTYSLSMFTAMICFLLGVVLMFISITKPFYQLLIGLMILLGIFLVGSNAYLLGDQTARILGLSIIAIPFLTIHSFIVLFSDKRIIVMNVDWLYPIYIFTTLFLLYYSYYTIAPVDTEIGYTFQYFIRFFLENYFIIGSFITLAFLIYVYFKSRSKLVIQLLMMFLLSSCPYLFSIIFDQIYKTSFKIDAVFLMVLFPVIISLMIFTNQLTRMIWIRKEIYKFQETELERLSSELHDSIKQDLYFLAQKLNKLDNNPDFLKRKTEIVEQLAMVQDQLREICLDLKPQGLATGLITEIKKVIDKLSYKCDFEIIFENNKEMETMEKKLSEDMRLFLYRLVQELINNAYKYSQASEVRLRLLATTTNVYIDYMDDGIGIAEQLKTGKIGWGLKYIENKVINFGGSIEMASEKGLTITVSLPI